MADPVALVLERATAIRQQVDRWIQKRGSHFPGLISQALTNIFASLNVLREIVIY